MATWEDIPGYGGHYQASLSGKIRVKDRIITKPHSNTGEMTEHFYAGKELAQMTLRYGHSVVRIGVDGKRYTLHVGRLVLLAFVGAPQPEQECCHNNGNAGDNRLRNLRWDTHAANNADRLRHGRYSSGGQHPMAKLRKRDVSHIRRSKKTGKEMAEKYGVSTTQISRIRRGESWQ